MAKKPNPKAAAKATVEFMGGVDEAVESFRKARTMASEVGKTIREARGEISRTVQTLAVSAEEARRLAGEVVPFDGALGLGTGAGVTLISGSGKKPSESAAKYKPVPQTTRGILFLPMIS